MIDAMLVEALTSLGRSGEARIPDLLRDPDRAWRLIMCGDEPWRRTAAALEESSLSDLVRGLILYSQASGWSGMSVSPVITLFREYKTRALDSTDLAEWVLANRRNADEPYGQYVPITVHSLAELGEWHRGVAERKAAKYALEERRRAEAVARRAEEATELLLKAVRRGDGAAVVSLLKRGADPLKVAPDGHTLIGIAEKLGHVTVVEALNSNASERDARPHAWLDISRGR